MYDYGPEWGDSLVSSPAVTAACCGSSATGLLGWIQAHPWLALAIAAGGLLVGSQMVKK